MSQKTSLPFVVLALVLAAGCVAPTGTVVRDVPQHSVEEFLGTTSFSGSSFSPDNSRVLVSSDSSGIFNVYAIPVDGGDPVQLTHSTEDSFFARGYFPTDERFLYTADQGGNELNHVYVQETDGRSRDLTPGEGLKARFLGWSDDDSFFYVATNERNPKYFDIYEYASSDYARELIFTNDDGLTFADISPDRRHLALGRTNTRADSDLFLFDRDTKKLTHITPHEGAINHLADRFTPNGKALVFRSDEGSEFRYLVSHDLETGERTVLDRFDWDVRFCRYSKAGGYRVVAINNDGRTELVVYRTSDGSTVTLPAIAGTEIESVVFSRDETQMAVYASGSRNPRDLFVQDLAGGEPRQLTHSLNPSIDAHDLVEGNVVRFESWDGLEVPGILYRPHQASPEKPAPALVFVHGGPGGQSTVRYDALVQYLVNHGYVVYAINNRGSSGYGKTFFGLDNHKHGEDDLDDCVASKKMLIDTGFVDPERIGIAGGSYGGYMVLAALTFRPEEFAMGIDIFGISNWQRTLDNIPPWWESFRQALIDEMGPIDDEAFFRKKSPLFHADNIVRPLMVLQGANDPRVAKVESDDIVEAARANGVPVEYVIFDDEGHGFRKKENRETGYRAILDFLDTHLKAAAEAKSDT